VRQLLTLHARIREEGPHVAPRKIIPARPSMLDPFKPEVERLLQKYPDAKGIRVLEELRSMGFQGGITLVRRHIAQLREKRAQPPVVRFETSPGRQGQMDWSPYRLKLRGGAQIEVLCFSYILAFSRRHFIDFTLHRDFHTLIRRHVDAFHHYGGVVRECLYDNEKTVVLRWEAGQPVYNPAFLRFITHYQCRPVACRPRTPQTKGKIERPFQYIESSLLNCREFDDLDDLRACARWWMANKSDLHLHDTTRRTPLELFVEQEKDALLPLPAHDYDTAEIAYVVGRDEGSVVFQTNRYSIPPQLVGSILTLRATESQVELYDPQMNRLALHPRLPEGAHLKNELDEHKDAPREARFGLDSIKDVFLTIGEEAERFLEGLKYKFPRNPGFHARRILTLRERYHSDDVHRAIAHANRYRAFDSASVERILKAKFTPRTLEQLGSDRAADALRNTLPKVPQRPLSVYRDAFSPTPTPITPEEPDDKDRT
jgi:transposase